MADRDELTRILHATADILASITPEGTLDDVMGGLSQVLADLTAHIVDASRRPVVTVDESYGSTNLPQRAEFTPRYDPATDPLRDKYGPQPTDPS